MSDKTKRDEAWRKLGVTNWRPPTPQELREVFNDAFDAGYTAATLERDKAVREFIEKMGYAKGTGAFIGMENEFRKMFGKEL